MKLSEYQKLSKRTLPARGDLQERLMALSNYGLGLAGESGECVDHIKKHVHHGHDLNVDEIKNELGDVLHYISGLATMCGISLEGIAAGNVEKLLKRYPEGFSKDASINRVEN